MNFVYNCIGVLLHTAQVSLCEAVLVYCYIKQRQLRVELYWCTLKYCTGKREFCVQLYWRAVI
jgi:hypothetical protein